MKKKIVIRTDASVDPSSAVGVGYKAIIYKSNGSYDKKKGSNFIPKKIKTTEAEMIAAVFGVGEIYRDFIQEKGSYTVVVETDCMAVVDRVEQGGEGNMERVMDFFARQFKDFKVRWIGRECNTHADAIARETLRRGIEE